LKDIVDGGGLVGIKLSVDTEDGTDRNVHIDVGGTIERIEDSDVLAVGVLNQDVFRVFLACHDADLATSKTRVKKLWSVDDDLDD